MKNKIIVLLTTIFAVSCNLNIPNAQKIDYDKLYETSSSKIKGNFIIFERDNNKIMSIDSDSKPSIYINENGEGIVQSLYETKTIYKNIPVGNSFYNGSSIKYINNSGNGFSVLFGGIFNDNMYLDNKLNIFKNSKLKLKL